ncbi:MAG: ABC transporter substrate-binding protein [candidate division Zixibacteria bacterium]
MMFRIIVVFLTAILIPSSLSAQAYMEDPTIGMKAAMDDFQNGDYEEAYRKFNSLAGRFALDGHYSSFRFMSAKSLYEAGKYKPAIILFDKFVDDFPGSRFAVSALLLRGHCLYRQHMILDAASAYMSAYDLDPKNPDSELALSNLNPLIEKGLSLWELQQLISEHPASTLTEDIKFSIAQREFKAGRFRSGIKSLKSYLRGFPRGKYSKEARVLIKRYSEKAESTRIIGLLAPVSGVYTEYGRSMVEAARLAMKFYGHDSLGIELMIKDTGGDAVTATKVASKLAKDEPIAVIGPLRSESSVGAAVVLNAENIPIITPTASESGIASLGPNVFQISPPIERLGQAMAYYAIDELCITEFAIISPDDAGGMAVSKAFAQTVYRLGGEVISTSYYTTGATDFKQQIRPLRETLLMKTEELLAAGEIDSTLYIKEYVLEVDTIFADTVETVEFHDPEDWPVNIGGLFLPGYPDELKLLIPQIRYHVIRGQFLGADGWDSETLIREVSRYVGDAVFATDFHAGSDEVNWVEFSNAYSAEFGHQPDKVAALTFDAVAMVLRGLSEGADSPEKIRGFLNEIEGYQGVSCRITFKGAGRANNEIRIYSVIEGKVATAR